MASIRAADYSRADGGSMRSSKDKLRQRGGTLLCVLALIAATFISPGLARSRSTGA
jgi:hypothetical protein